jgi:4-hydroxybutyryl-CoA dehydratase/vinylacetyl-CoA-Delta-isomerase
MAYQRDRSNVSVKGRAGMLRLIETMMPGRNAVGYPTRPLYGAGSPQGQRIQIAREMNVDEKIGFADALAGSSRTSRMMKNPEAWPDFAYWRD